MPKYRVRCSVAILSPNIRSSQLKVQKKKMKVKLTSFIQQYVSINNSSRRVGNRSESTCICHMIVQYYSTVCGVFDCIWNSAWNRHLTCLSVHISFSNTSTLSFMSLCGTGDNLLVLILWHRRPCLVGEKLLVLVLQHISLLFDK